MLFENVFLSNFSNLVACIPDTTWMYPWVDFLLFEFIWIYLLIQIEIILIPFRPIPDYSITVYNRLLQRSSAISARDFWGNKKEG